MANPKPYPNRTWYALAVACGLAACARQDATAVEHCTAASCAGASASTTADRDSGAGKAGSAGGAHTAGTGGSAGRNAGSGGGAGGKGSAAGTSASSTGGAGGSSAGSGGNAGSSGSSAADAGSMKPPIPKYTLVVDAPTNGDTLSGTVTVSGRAPGFLNVEVWDSMHQMPPLAQTAPDADGNFSTTIDVSALAPGGTTWTVFGWDSPPGQSFMHTSSVTLNLMLQTGNVDPASCAGQTCSGHGTCDASSGRATCTCDAKYHAVGQSCIADQVGGADGQPDPGMAYVPSGYHLVFNDEFTDSTLDTGKWNTLAPFGVQFFSDSHQKQAFVPEAVSLSGGILTFTAQPSNGNANAKGQPYTSGSITTNQSFTYGYFETRTKLPQGKGFWPAYWVTSSSRWPPEWDIFEIIDGVIYGYTHPVSGGKCSFVEGAAGSDSTYTIANVYGSYHVYGFEWTASDLYWYVDGVMTEHYAVDAAAGANDPFWLNISFQIGGDWPGDPDGSTHFPAQMEVDYMRVYQK